MFRSKFWIPFACMTFYGKEEKLSSDPSGSGGTLDSVVHIGQVI